MLGVGLHVELLASNPNQLLYKWLEILMGCAMPDTQHYGIRPITTFFVWISQGILNCNFRISGIGTFLKLGGKPCTQFV